MLDNFLKAVVDRLTAAGITATVGYQCIVIGDVEFEARYTSIRRTRIRFLEKLYVAKSEHNYPTPTIDKAVLSVLNALPKAIQQAKEAKAAKAERQTRIEMLDKVRHLFTSLDTFTWLDYWYHTTFDGILIMVPSKGKIEYRFMIKHNDATTWRVAIDWLMDNDLLK